MARMRVQETVRTGRYRPGNGEAAGAYTGHKLYVLVLHRSTAPVACTWPVWKAPPFPDCGNGILSSRYLRFQELIADLLRRPVPVR